MRPIGLLLALLCLPQQAPPTFKSGVALVTVDVSVLDRDGRPVEGLAATDFEVRLDGRVYPVKVASFLQTATRRVVSTADATSGTLADSPQAMASDPRIYVVLVDDLSFAATRGKRLFVSAERFVRTLPSADMVGLATTSGSVTVNPTTDRLAIFDALRRVSGQFTDPRLARPQQMGGGREGGFSDQPLGLMQALNIDRGDIGTLKDVIANECFGGDRTAVNTQSVPALAVENNCVTQIQREALRTAALIKAGAARQAAALASLLDVLRPVPGYKQLMVLTDGLAVGSDPDPLRPIAPAAARAGVRVSVLLEDQDLSITDEGRRADNLANQNDVGMAARRREDARLVLQGAQTAAAMAGGQFFRITGDPDPVFARAALAASAIYRLGLEAPRDSAPDRQYELEARVRTRTDVSVAASRVAMVALPEAPPTTAEPLSAAERLKAALGVGRDLAAIPMTVRTALRRAATAPSNSALELVVAVELRAAPGPLLTMFGLVDQAGGMRVGQQALTSPPDNVATSTSFVLPVTAGRYRLRIAASDATGALGSLELPIAAELGTMGPFLSSDLLTTAVDAQGQGAIFVTDVLPDEATSLGVTLELYAAQAVPASDVLVQWEVIPVGQTDPVEDREVRASASGTMLRAEAEFDRALFAPGAYVVRATVRQADAVIGRVVRNLSVR